MEKEILLKNGKKIPALGFGTWELNGKTCENAVKTALELGYNHIDTAEIYFNQKEVGKALSQFDRKKIFLTSKVWTANLKHDSVLKACDSTLKDLQTDYLDLYLIHWPNKKIPIKETLSALKTLVDSGKVKSIGVSNFTIAHIKEALQLEETPIVNNQVEFHPYLFQKDLLEFCQSKKIVLTAYSPLGRKKILNDKTILELSKKYNKTPAQICLNWVLQKGCVAIPKASSKEHIAENLNVFDFTISTEDCNKIDSLGNSKRIVNPLFGEFGRKE